MRGEERIGFTIMCARVLAPPFVKYIFYQKFASDFQVSKRITDIVCASGGGYSILFFVLVMLIIDKTGKFVIN